MSNIIQRIQAIDNEIIELKKQLENIKGREISVYTRIVGYHRAVSNWNRGKEEEYKFRKIFDIKQKDWLGEEYESNIHRQVRDI